MESQRLRGRQFRSAPWSIKRTLLTSIAATIGLLVVLLNVPRGEGYGGHETLGTGDVGHASKTSYGVPFVWLEQTSMDWGGLNVVGNHGGLEVHFGLLALNIVLAFLGCYLTVSLIKRPHATTTDGGGAQPPLERPTT